MTRRGSRWQLAASLKRRARQKGFSLAEASVAMALALLLLLGTLTFFDLASRDTRKKADGIDNRRISQATLDHLVRTLRQSQTGLISENPANCLSCHADVDGEFVDNPETNCGEDMTSPRPPMNLDLWSVDPADSDAVTDAPEFLRVRPVGLPGDPPPPLVNGISFNADLSQAPDDLVGTDIEFEERSFYTLDDVHGDGQMLYEAADHDGDGDDDEILEVAFGVHGIEFESVLGPPRKYENGDLVTATCRQGGCHVPITGAGGVYSAGTTGEIWKGEHPDSQSLLAIKVRLATGENVPSGPNGELEPLVLEALVRPRGLGL
ncbi:MAG: hypothetical protein AAF533_25675 [Acidobacteriota bacterium]